MKSYKKRAKSGWCGGKAYKKDSNRSERQFEKEEIQKALHEMEQGEDFRYKYKAKKQLTPTQRKYKQLNSIKLYLKRWESKSFPKDSWIMRVINSYKNMIKKLKQQIKELENKNGKEPKQDS